MIQSSACALQRGVTSYTFLFDKLATMQHSKLKMFTVDHLYTLFISTLVVNTVSEKKKE